MAKDAVQSVQSGPTLSFALGDLLPPFATHMLQIGEETGDSVKTLDNTVAHFNGEVSESIERMVATIEPALTVGIGLLLAWVVLAVLGPIYGSVVQLGHMQ